jgi:hypothetical protein
MYRLKWLVVMCIAIAGVAVMTDGCAQWQAKQTATQQMSTHTNDPHMMALAGYADALDMYLAAAKLYLPYQPYMEKFHPGRHQIVLGAFESANQILSDWKRLGGMTPDGQKSFRYWIRQISIEAAMAQSKGGE